MISSCFIISHPYGPLGGNLDNNVVHALFSNFASFGYTTLRFNFRGVGGSSGRTTFRGLGEIDDVVACANYLRSRPDIAMSKIVVCGYSYGSLASCAAICEIPETAAVISISFPSGVMWALTLGNHRKHIAGLQAASDKIIKFFISGSRDNFTSEANFRQFTDSISDPKTVLVVPDADHFWNGTEQNLMGHVNQWRSKFLQPHLGERGSLMDLTVKTSTSSSTTSTSTSNLLAGSRRSPVRDSPGSRSSSPDRAAAIAAEQLRAKAFAAGVTASPDAIAPNLVDSKSTSSPTLVGTSSISASMDAISSSSGQKSPVKTSRDPSPIRGIALSTAKGSLGDVRPK
eukprot:jgi/Hompol1/6548/HPOL_005037-RA